MTESIIHLHQPRPKTAAERGRAYRKRQREMSAARSRKSASSPAEPIEKPTFTNGEQPKRPVRQRPTAAVRFERPTLPPKKGGGGAPVSSLPVVAVTPVAPLEAEVPSNATPSRRSAAPIILTVAALGLALVGTVQNGWYAMSLGATLVAGYLFLILGVASDAIALVLPSVAARAWQTRQRGAAVAAWLVWILTFAFALVSSVGFVSTNIADVTMVRASRETSAVKSASASLADAMAARDRECKGGVGRYCREREQTVVDRQQALDATMQTVAQAADPQAVAAVKLVSWVTGGAISPNENDFGMLRLALLCLLPQLAGVLLMVGKRSNDGGTQGTMTSTPWTIIKSRQTAREPR